MIFKKLCTICNTEYTGEKCPECEKRLKSINNVKTDKQVKAPKPAKKKIKKEIVKDNDEDLQNKIQQLIEKYK